MKKIIRLTESDLTNIIKRVIKEQKDKVTGQSKPLVNRPKMENMEMDEEMEMNEGPGCYWPRVLCPPYGCQSSQEVCTRLHRMHKAMRDGWYGN
jgi:hypothetical protein